METQKKKLHYCPHQGCTASFTRPYRLADHIFAAHTNVRAYVCNEEGCDKSYSNKSHLIRHVNIVHKKLGNDVIYSCPICMRNYVNRQNLHRHMKSHHSSATAFSCDFCRIVFKKKNQLKAHIYQHTGVKSFSCELCEKLFVTYCEKRKHMRCHKNYECSYCSQRFDVWSKYQKHKKMEHEPKEYICNDCSRSFKKRCHIVRHVKTHDDKQPLYMCPYEECGRYYTAKNNLRAHITINHYQIKHGCDLCGAQLSSKHILKKHLNQHARYFGLQNNLAVEIETENVPSVRQKRKDLGSMKVSTASKLAGYPIDKEEGNISEQCEAD